MPSTPPPDYTYNVGRQAGEPQWVPSGEGGGGGEGQAPPRSVVNTVWISRQDLPGGGFYRTFYSTGEHTDAPRQPDAPAQQPQPAPAQFRTNPAEVQEKMQLAGLIPQKPSVQVQVKTPAQIKEEAQQFSMAATGTPASAAYYAEKQPQLYGKLTGETGPGLPRTPTTTPLRASAGEVTGVQIATAQKRLEAERGYLEQRRSAISEASEVEQFNRQVEQYNLSANAFGALAGQYNLQAQMKFNQSLEDAGYAYSPAPLPYTPKGGGYEFAPMPIKTEPAYTLKEGGFVSLVGGGVGIAYPPGEYGASFERPAMLFAKTGIVPEGTYVVEPKNLQGRSIRVYNLQGELVDTADFGLMRPPQGKQTIQQQITSAVYEYNAQVQKGDIFRAGIESGFDYAITTQKNEWIRGGLQGTKGIFSLATPSFWGAALSGAGGTVALAITDIETGDYGTTKKGMKAAVAGFSAQFETPEALAGTAVMGIGSLAFGAVIPTLKGAAVARTPINLKGIQIGEYPKITNIAEGTLGRGGFAKSPIAPSEGFATEATPLNVQAYATAKPFGMPEIKFYYKTNMPNTLSVARTVGKSVAGPTPEGFVIVPEGGGNLPVSLKPGAARITLDKSIGRVVSEGRVITERAGKATYGPWEKGTLEVAGYAQPPLKFTPIKPTIISNIAGAIKLNAEAMRFDIANALNKQSLPAVWKARGPQYNPGELIEMRQLPKGAPRQPAVSLPEGLQARFSETKPISGYGWVQKFKGIFEQEGGGFAKTDVFLVPLKRPAALQGKPIGQIEWMFEQPAKQPKAAGLGTSPFEFKAEDFVRTRNFAEEKPPSMRYVKAGKGMKQIQMEKMREETISKGVMAKMQKALKTEAEYETRGSPFTMRMFAERAGISVSTQRMQTQRPAMAMENMQTLFRAGTAAFTAQTAQFREASIFREVSMQRPATMNIERMASIQRPMQIERPATMNIERMAPIEIFRPGQIYVPPNPPPWTPPPWIPLLPPMPKFGFDESSRNIIGLGTKRRTKYLPSIFATAFNIRKAGKASESAFSFGEIRPIYTDGKRRRKK